MLDTTRQERVEQERRWVQRGEELESLKAKCDEAVVRRPYLIQGYLHLCLKGLFA